MSTALHAVPIILSVLVIVVAVRYEINGRRRHKVYMEHHDEESP